ncbi:MAG: hypothetical protein HY908_17125 [Myxococcales bacterium]|nr:hypothetical protein [Myxococcales bacterium]
MRAARARSCALALALLALTGCCPPVPPPPPPPVRPVAGGFDPQLLLGAPAAAARGAGAGELVTLGAMVASEGDQVGAFVEVAAADCLLVLARPSESLEDVDLLLFSDAGDLVAADEAPEPAAAVLRCPPHPARMYAAARVVSGTGVLALGAMPVPLRAAAAVAAAVGARGRDGDATGRLAAWPGLEAKILERRRGLGSHWEDLRRAALPLDPTAATVMTVPIGARRCVDVLASPSAEVAEIDLEVLDREGRVVTRGEGVGRDRAAVVCTEEAHEVTVRVRPRATSGTCALVVSRAPEGAVSELADAARVYAVTALRPLAAELAAHDAALARQGLGPPRSLGTGTARSDGAGALALVLEAGCARLDVVAGTPLGPFEATLWDEAGTRIAAGSGGAAVALFRCGPKGPVRLEVRARGVPGPFGVGTRTDAAPPPELLLLPRAASSLLARLDAAEGPVGPGAARGVERVPLGAGPRAVRPLPVPAGACVEVIAALAAPHAGVELRLVDPSVAEPRLARGEHATSARLCAGAADVAGTLELGLDAGSGEALVLRRPLPAGAP